MKKHKLTAEPRTLVGRKVKQLRRSGLLPASVYGKKVKSRSVAVKLDDFAKIYKEAGESGLVELSVDHEVRPVLIHNVQKDVVTGLPLHIEFYQVDLKEKVHAKVPIEIVGEAPAVREKQGVLLTILDEIEVEALPTELPEKVTVDISSLAAVDQEIKVSDIKVAAGVSLLTEAGLTVVKIGALVTKEVQAEAAAEEAAKAAAEAAAAAPTEGETAPEAPAPGEAPQTPPSPTSPSEEKKE